MHFQGASTRIFIHHLGYREGEPVQDAGISPSLIASFTSLMGVRRTGYSPIKHFLNMKMEHACPPPKPPIAH